ncbi:amidohydrolase family protein [Phytoactinopolyspora limicola]|uniref:amidohydrolase family protein n=1 Tax=Phytoactinopolyspora limicola TaxID=2715536 RepID=UPI001407761D|nr:amidohydrolase family protein [Phytoactinopolyspora limicola]
MFDVHAHAIPDGLIHTLRRDGPSLGVEIVDTDRGTQVRVADGPPSAPLDPLLSDLPARLAAMDRGGVDVQVVSPFIGLTAYSLPAEAGARYSRLFNELMASTAAQAPDRLRALATVPLQSGDLAARELTYAVEHLGMAGVEIGTSRPGGQVDDPDLEPFWAAANHLRCLVLIHPMSGTSHHEPYFLGNLVANPAQTTLAAARLMFGGVLDRFPDLRICLVHGGGFLPYQAGRLEHGFATYGQRWGARLDTSPAELIRRFSYDTVLHSPTALRALLDQVGADRVLVGTDYPFAMGDDDPAGTLAAVPALTSAQHDLIRRDNARRLLTPRDLDE